LNYLGEPRHHSLLAGPALAVDKSWRTSLKSQLQWWLCHQQSWLCTPTTTRQGLSNCGSTGLALPGTEVNTAGQDTHVYTRTFEH